MSSLARYEEQWHWRFMQVVAFACVFVATAAIYNEGASVVRIVYAVPAVTVIALAKAIPSIWESHHELLCQIVNTVNGFTSPLVHSANTHNQPVEGFGTFVRLAMALGFSPLFFSVLFSHSNFYVSVLGVALYHFSVTALNPNLPSLDSGLITLQQTVAWMGFQLAVGFLLPSYIAHRRSKAWRRRRNLALLKEFRTELQHESAATAAAASSSRPSSFEKARGSTAAKGPVQYRSKLFVRPLTAVKMRGVSLAQLTHHHTESVRTAMRSQIAPYALHHPQCMAMVEVVDGCILVTADMVTLAQGGDREGSFMPSVCRQTALSMLPDALQKSVTSVAVEQYASETNEDMKMDEPVIQDVSPCALYCGEVGQVLILHVAVDKRSVLATEDCWEPLIISTDSGRVVRPLRCVWTPEDGIPDRVLRTLDLDSDAAAQAARLRYYELAVTLPKLATQPSALRLLIQSRSEEMMSETSGPGRVLAHSQSVVPVLPAPLADPLVEYGGAEMARDIGFVLAALDSESRAGATATLTALPLPIQEVACECALHMAGDLMLEPVFTFTTESVLPAVRGRKVWKARRFCVGSQTSCPLTLTFDDSELERAFRVSWAHRFGWTSVLFPVVSMPLMYATYAKIGRAAAELHNPGQAVVLLLHLAALYALTSSPPALYARVFPLFSAALSLSMYYQINQNVPWIHQPEARFEPRNLAVLHAISPWLIQGFIRVPAFALGPVSVAAFVYDIYRHFVTGLSQINLPAILIRVSIVVAAAFHWTIEAQTRKRFLASSLTASLAKVAAKEC